MNVQNQVQCILSTRPKELRDFIGPLSSGQIHQNESGILPSLPDADSTGHKEIIAKLAELPPLNYEQIREETAKKLGVRVSALDKEVQKALPEKPAADVTEPSIIETLEAWPDNVDGASLAEEIRGCLRKYVVFSAAGDSDVAALWILGSSLMDTWRLWPRVMITSPTKACGKSTLLEVIEALAHRGLIISNTKSAGVFRAIEAWRPTLLMDEADTWMKEDAELAGILNSGHTKRTARVIRVQEIGGELKPTLFSTWCPMVIAGIGTQRDTLTSRSVVIGLRRKMAIDVVQRLPIDLHEQMTQIRRRSTRWANDHAVRLSAMTSEPPECGNDRRRDNFAPLWRIAEVLGGLWPDRLAAAYAVPAATDDDEPAGVMMLRDLMEIFEQNPDAKHLATSALVGELTSQEERPWSDWRNGRPITAQTISRLMKPFGVRPANAKISGRVLKAYSRRDIEEAYNRYAAALRKSAATTLPR